MGSTRFRNPRALSSALATLGTLRPRALGFLNPVDPMDSISNLYIGINYDLRAVGEQGKGPGAELELGGWGALESSKYISCLQVNSVKNVYFATFVVHIS